MDFNVFDLEELLRCPDFSRYESILTRDVKEDFKKYVKEHAADEKTAEKIESECEDYAYCVFCDAFKQGFCFAMKSVKFLMKI